MRPSCFHFRTLPQHGPLGVVTRVRCVVHRKAACPYRTETDAHNGGKQIRHPSHTTRARALASSPISMGHGMLKKREEGNRRAAGGGDRVLLSVKETCNAGEASRSRLQRDGSGSGNTYR